MSKDSLLEPLSSSHGLIGTCGDCRYYCKPEQECRRSAPTPFPVPGQSKLTGQPTISVVGLWPGTKGGNWCGEWRARRGEP